MYDGVAVLIAYEHAYDEYGRKVPIESRKQVFVQPRGVYASEFYTAQQLGLKPSVTLDMTDQRDYDGQKVLEYNGRRYNVVRVDWTAQRDGISLICEERLKNESGDDASE